MEDFAPSSVQQLKQHLQGHKSRILTDLYALLHIRHLLRRLSSYSTSPEAQTPGLQSSTGHQQRPSSSCSSSVCLDQGSSIPLTDRVELLLDLAFLSLRLQHHQTASDCLKELRATVGQRVMTECVQCELELNKHREGMENYSRSSVEFDSILLLDVLCRVHAELAAIDEENEKLDSAMTHLQKALELDPDSEHLSSSLHLLQLRSSVHSAPTRPEERAAKLIQQMLHRPSPHTFNEWLSCTHRQLTAEGRSLTALLCKISQMQ
ncbi:hypothetical protein G5714_013836 [Onychostoma macrolepis]|uniref:Uncharacterized protein n=1 Tax=Onychostoma macrolepis TaxID=369639 RepID=A0A7J6CGG3_9TELE|nr:hypothetical protein G5714_013836 [Onychostoma macrolepis]